MQRRPLIITEMVITKFQHQNPRDYGRSKLTSTVLRGTQNLRQLIPHTPPLNEYSKTIKQKEQKQRKGNKVSWRNLGRPALRVELHQKSSGKDCRMPAGCQHCGAEPQGKGSGKPPGRVHSWTRDHLAPLQELEGKAPQTDTCSREMWPGHGLVGGSCHVTHG